MSRTIVRHAYPAVLAGILFVSFAHADARAASSVIQDVRVGEHPGATRVVLDISRPTNATFDVSEDGRTLSILMPDADWRAGDFAAKHAKGHLTDFRHAVTADGVRLSLRMNEPIKIKQPFFVSPEGSYGHRVVIDIETDPASSAAAKPVKDIAVERMVAGPASIAPMRTETAQAYTLTPDRPNRSAAVPPRQTAQAVPPSRAMPPRADDRPLGGLLYVKAAAGLNVLEEGAAEGSSNQAAIETDLGWIANAGVGLDLKNNFRLEGEVLYAANSVKAMTGTVNGAGVNSGQPDGDVSMLGFMANVAYDFVNAYPITPFIFGGAGLALVSLDGVSAPGNAGYDDNDAVFALQAGAGVATDLTDRTTLDLSYRYFETQDPEFSDANGTPFNYEYATHMIMMGVRYKF